MALKASFSKRTFHFSFPARTSRGAVHKKDSWFLKIWNEKDPGLFGLGEAGPLPWLSAEKASQVEAELNETIKHIESLGNGDFGSLKTIHEALDFSQLSSSVSLAVEVALLDLAGGGKRKIFDNGFFSGTPVPINGLIWMGGLDFVLQQVSIKIEEVRFRRKAV